MRLAAHGAQRRQEREPDQDRGRHLEQLLPDDELVEAADPLVVGAVLDLLEHLGDDRADRPADEEPESRAQPSEPPPDEHPETHRDEAKRRVEDLPVDSRDPLQPLVNLPELVRCDEQQQDGQCLPDPRDGGRLLGPAQEQRDDRDAGPEGRRKRGRNIPLSVQIEDSEGRPEDELENGEDAEQDDDRPDRAEDSPGVEPERKLLQPVQEAGRTVQSGTS